MCLKSADMWEIKYGWKGEWKKGLQVGYYKVITGEGKMKAKLSGVMIAVDWPTLSSPGRVFCSGLQKLN